MIEVSGAGYVPEGVFSAAVNDPSIQWLLKAGLLCSDAALVGDGGRWSVKGDPTEGAMVVLAVKAGLHQEETRLECPRIEEFPFSSERKRMTTIHTMEDGKRVAFVKGAPEVLLERCSSLLDGGERRALNDDARVKILRVNEEMAKDALRVLGVGYKELPKIDGYGEDFVEKDLAFLGWDDGSAEGGGHRGCEGLSAGPYQTRYDHRGSQAHCRCHRKRTWNLP